MDRFIAKKNIEHFIRQLAVARDPAERGAFARLLAEAEEHLRRADAAHAETPHSEPHLRAPASVDNESADGEAGGRRRISGIVEHLQVETDQDQRLCLRHRLIEEADKFGALSRRMDLADAYIEDSALRVAAIERMVAGLTGDGEPRRRQLASLATSLEILEIFKSYRAVLAEQAGRIDI